MRGLVLAMVSEKGRVLVPNDTDGARPDTGHDEAKWIFRIGRASVLCDWSTGAPDTRELQPWRLPRASALARHSPTHVYCQTTKSHLLVESGTERELVEELDGDPDITWIVSQPCEIHFRLAHKKVKRHVPDLLVRDSSGVTLWDVRPDHRQTPEFLQVAAWSAAAAEAVGWGYRIFGGHPPARRVNQLWVSAYRQASPCIEAYAETIACGCLDGSITTVGDVVRRDSGYGQLTSAMWHLVWAHRLACDLDSPITMDSSLRWVVDARG